jgi:Uncharacterised protein family (UPF0158)
MVRIRLTDIIDAIEMQFEEIFSFLNLDTGEVETVSHELLRAAEEFGVPDPPDLLTWQEAEWEVAKRIAASDRFVELPTKFGVHEWAIMRDFSSTVGSEGLRDELVRAIHGRGAFRRFKEVVRLHGIESEWFTFRADALARIARDWCDQHGIVYE